MNTLDPADLLQKQPDEQSHLPHNIDTLFALQAIHHFLVLVPLLHNAHYSHFLYKIFEALLSAPQYSTMV
jgi:hypothetical protein